MDDGFRHFGKSINRLISGEDLSREETRELFSEILNGEQPEIHQGAFLAAITSKGPSTGEIAGVWEAIFNLDTVKVTPDVDKPLLDNCGTGMDSFKTFNISTGAAIVGAAGGVCMARHGSRALSSRCGTVDMCEALGVDVECRAEKVKESIEQAGIGLFNGMSRESHPEALFRILSQISFGSILNIAASLANPANPDFGVRGVYSKEMIEPAILTMKEIGFKKALVFHGTTGNGAGGIDELSPVSESYISELSEDGRISNYTLVPENMGIKRMCTTEDIAGGKDPHEEALRLLKIFTGMDKNGLYDTICLNAAPVFYISGEVNDLKAGAEMAREIIDSGRAMEKLRQWVEIQHRVPERGRLTIETLLNELN